MRRYRNGLRFRVRGLAVAGAGLVVVAVASVVFVISGDPAWACSTTTAPPFDSIVNEQADGRVVLSDGILGVVEFETVRVWEPAADYTGASVAVPTRAWVGQEPVNAEPIFLGGVYVGATATTSSCVPSRARPLGDLQYFYLGRGGSLRGFAESDASQVQELVLAGGLGEARELPMSIPTDFPRRDGPLAGQVLSDEIASEDNISTPTRGLHPLLIALSALGVGIAVTVLGARLLRSRHRHTR